MFGAISKGKKYWRGSERSAIGEFGVGFGRVG